VFECFKDIYPLKEMQDKIDRKIVMDYKERARLAKEQAEKNRALMDNGMQPQNPYTYLNPNRVISTQPQPNPMNGRTIYTNPIAGTWYGNNMYNNSYYSPYSFNPNNTKFMEPTKEDIKSGRGVIATVVEGPVKKDNKPPTTTRRGRNLKIGKVSVVIAREANPEFYERLEDGENPNDILFGINKKKKKEYINPDGNTPLDWSKPALKREFVKLANEVKVYNFAAYIFIKSVFEARCVSKEDWHYMKIGIRDMIDTYKRKEDMNPHLDFRASYRYRKTPYVAPNVEIPSGLNKDTVGREMPCLKIPDRYNEGKMKYDYDRGTDELSYRDKWIFVRRAQIDIEEVANEARNLDREKEKKRYDIKPPNLKDYNMADYNQRIMYFRNLDIYKNKINENFFRDVFRNKLSDEEFDKWWFGTSSPELMRPTQMVSPENMKEYNRRVTLDQNRKLTDQNIAFLRSIQVQERQMEIYRQQYWNTVNMRRNQLFEGTMRDDMSLRDVMDNLYFWSEKSRDDDAKIQQQRNIAEIQQRLYHKQYQSAIYQTFNNPDPRVATNYNPQYPLSSYPRLGPNSLGLPENYADPFATPEIQKRKEQFLNYCNTTTGQAPLKPVWK